MSWLWNCVSCTKQTTLEQESEKAQKLITQTIPKLNQAKKKKDLSDIIDELEITNAKMTKISQSALNKVPSSVTNVKKISLKCINYTFCMFFIAAGIMNLVLSILDLTTDNTPSSKNKTIIGIQIGLNAIFTFLTACVSVGSSKPCAPSDDNSKLQQLLISNLEAMQKNNESLREIKNPTVINDLTNSNKSLSKFSQKIMKQWYSSNLKLILPRMFSYSLIVAAIIAGCANFSLSVVKEATNPPGGDSDNAWLPWVKIPLQGISIFLSTFATLGLRCCDCKADIESKKLKKLLENNMQVIEEAHLLIDFSEKIGNLDGLDDNDHKNQELELEACKASYDALSDQTKKLLPADKFFPEIIKKFFPKHQLSKLIKHFEIKMNQATEPSNREVKNILDTYQNKLDNFGLLEFVNNATQENEIPDLTLTDDSNNASNEVTINIPELNLDDNQHDTNNNNNN